MYYAILSFICFSNLKKIVLGQGMFIFNPAEEAFERHFHLELRLYYTEVGLLSLGAYPGVKERSTSEQLLEHTSPRQASVYRGSLAPS